MVDMNTQVDATHAAQVIGNLLNVFTGRANSTDTGSLEALTTPGTPPPTASPGSTQALTQGSRSAPDVAYTGGTSNYSGNGSQDQFFRDVLQGIGAPITDENMRFMQAWSQWEIPDPSYYNPFATTLDYGGGQSINSANVRRYPDEQTGVQATIQTIRQDNFRPIFDQLMAGNSSINAAIALANTDWGSGNGPLQILQGA